MKKPVNEILAEAVKVLREGGVILYPTDTIWGIGCDATNPEAVAKVYGIKKRPDSKSLVLLADSLDMVGRYVREIPDIAVQLVEVNDRPMTIIYPDAICGKAPAEGSKAVADRHFLAYNAVAEDGSVGIRVPMNEFCRNLCYKLGRPVVSTSANLSGEASPERYADIPQEIISAVDYVVDPALERDSQGKASQIIKVGLRGEIQIIRP
ncbi:MAG: L-threonylcarbamoyladenylate synthase [Bacteroidales bacterium]|nr:L-threonylcarbamoyladenylate synthase [Bacteroidales bacterium]